MPMVLVQQFYASEEDEYEELGEPRELELDEGELEMLARARRIVYLENRHGYFELVEAG